MHLGPWEIALIIVVIIAVAVITRVLRTNYGSARQNKESSVDIQIKPNKVRTSKIRNLLKRTGIAFTLTGIILLFAGIGMFKWALQSYLWSLILIAIGIVLIFLFRKK